MSSLEDFNSAQRRGETVGHEFARRSEERKLALVEPQPEPDSKDPDQLTFRALNADDKLDWLLYWANNG